MSEGGISGTVVDQKKIFKFPVAQVAVVAMAAVDVRLLDAHHLLLGYVADIVIQPHQVEITHV